MMKDTITFRYRMSDRDVFYGGWSCKWCQKYHTDGRCSKTFDGKNIWKYRKM